MLWELICHHTYKWDGRPVDISRYDNPAEVTNRQFVADGIAPGSGALRFVNRAAIVHVDSRGPAWNPLVAIKVELTAKMTDPTSGRQILIEADNSFGVFVDDEKVFAYFFGKSIYPGTTTDGLNTEQDGLAFPGYRLPYGKWTTLTFVHDGFSQMRLFADGVPVTVTRSVLSAIPPVGPQGVCIGNGINGGAIFAGDIDDVKIWRQDPYENLRQFLARPMDKATRECLERFSASLDAALAKHPDCALKLDADFSALIGRLVRSIVSKGPESRQRFFEVQGEFDRLWRAGKINGPEIRKLFADWIAWLRLVGISIEADAAVQAFQNSDCLKLLLGEIEGLDCDPRHLALLKLIGDVLGEPPANPAAT
jgi:hypothetical protein